jgi:magnesium-transporting ATPase (P-type)
LEAGIAIKILTGDNPQTTATIAREINFEQEGDLVNGAVLMQLEEKEYLDAIQQAQYFYQDVSGS